ncbi:MAG: PEP-CTERM sorting domain-containing protein [Sedimentisphaerales bacterium]
MKNLITIAVIILAVSGLTHATTSNTIVKYDFGIYNYETLDPCNPADHISASDFGYVGDGATSFTDHSGYGEGYQVYGGWPYSEYSDYFYFTVAIAPGWSLDLDATGLEFDASTTNMSGPNLGRVTYLGNPETIMRDNIEIGGSSWWNYDTYSLLPPTGLTGSVEFRIYGREAYTYGTFSVDNVILNGTVNQIPEPTTICLLGLGALSLVRKKG